MGLSFRRKANEMIKTLRVTNYKALRDVEIELTPIHVLIGPNDTGKTSILKEVLAQVDKSAGGFYTEEIRASGTRQGFDIVTLDRQRATLAHIGIQSPYRVSKYGVDLAALEKVAVPAIKKAVQE